MAGVDLRKAGLDDDAKKTNYCIMLGWAWLGLAGLGMADVLRRFGTFWNVLGRLKPIYCITILKQVSTCSKDDAIIQRGNGLGWP